MTIKEDSHRRMVSPQNEPANVYRDHQIEKILFNITHIWMASHLNVSASVCLLRWLARINILSYWSHSYDLFPDWISLCWLILRKRLNALLQKSHENGFFLDCSRLFSCKPQCDSWQHCYWQLLMNSNVRMTW